LQAAFAAVKGIRILTDVLVTGPVPADLSQTVSDATELRPYQMVGLLAANVEGFYVILLQCIYCTALRPNTIEQDVAYFGANGFKPAMQSFQTVVNAHSSTMTKFLSTSHDNSLPSTTPDIMVFPAVLRKHEMH